MLGIASTSSPGGEVEAYQLAVAPFEIVAVSVFISGGGSGR